MYKKYTNYIPRPQAYHGGEKQVPWGWLWGKKQSSDIKADKYIFQTDKSENFILLNLDLHLNSFKL